MFTAEERLPKPDYKRAEREATRLLREAGVFQPPVNPILIATNLDLAVEFVEFPGESRDVSGLLDFDTASWVSGRVRKKQIPIVRARLLKSPDRIDKVKAVRPQTAALPSICTG